VQIAVLPCLDSGLYVASRMVFALASGDDAPAALIKLQARRAGAVAGNTTPSPGCREDYVFWCANYGK
jgi:L-asparagine transporter-like permease